MHVADTDGKADFNQLLELLPRNQRRSLVCCSLPG